MPNVDLPREEHGLPKDCADDLFDDPKFLRWYRRQDPETAEEKMARVRGRMKAVGAQPVKALTPQGLGGEGKRARSGPKARPVNDAQRRNVRGKKQRRSGPTASPARPLTPRHLG